MAQKRSKQTEEPKSRRARHKMDEADEEAQKKKDIMFMVVLFGIFVLAVVAMFLISKFLSGA